MTCTHCEKSTHQTTLTVESNISMLCQHVEIHPGFWVCPNCDHKAITSHAPSRECKPIEFATPIPTIITATPHRVIDPRESENQYLESIPTCKHRGEIIETDITCDVCGLRGQKYDTYACDIHDVCTLGNRKKAGDKMKACATCPDMVPLQLLFDKNSNRRIKITMICGGLHNPGGLERWLIALAYHLPMVSKGLVSVDYVIVRYPNQQDPDLTAELQKYTKVISNKETAETNAEIRDAIYETDVIIISGTNCPSEMFKKNTSPVIWVSHGFSPYTTKLSKEAFDTGLITHWTSVGHESVSAITDEAINLVTSIENGAEVERCAPVYGRAWQRDKWNLRNNQIAIGYVGRFSSDKNPLALARTIMHLPSNYVGIMIGAGWEKDKTIQEVKQIAGSRILFFDTVYHVGDVYAGLDFGFLASPAEGFCLGRTEMQLAGLPMFSTLTGELPRLHADHGELCVEIPFNGSGKEEADIILRSISDIQRINGIVERAKKLSWQKYTASAMAGRWVQYLRQIL